MQATHATQATYSYRSTTIAGTTPSRRRALVWRHSALWRQSRGTV